MAKLAQLPMKEHPSQSEICCNFDLTDEDFEEFTHSIVPTNTLGDTQKCVMFQT